MSMTVIGPVRSWFLAAVALIAFAALLAPAAPALAGPATTIVLVRHAEKAKEPAEDPPLTKDGQARAQTLAHVAGALGVTTIFTSRYTRTRQTAKPLAEALGLTPVEYDAGDGEALVKTILEQHEGETVLVSGHSNTVPPLIGLLGGPELPHIDGRVYDDLYVVTVPDGDGEVQVLHLRYGAPTPVPSGEAAGMHP